MGEDRDHVIRLGDTRRILSAMDVALVGLGWRDGLAEWSGCGERTMTTDALQKATVR